MSNKDRPRLPSVRRPGGKVQAHALMRKFAEHRVETCTTRPWLTRRTGFDKSTLGLWERGDCMPRIASVETCWNAMGKRLVVRDRKTKQPYPVPAGNGHWMVRVLAWLRRQRGLRVRELAAMIVVERTGKDGAVERKALSAHTLYGWEALRNSPTLDLYCDVLWHLGGEIVVRDADEGTVEVAA